MAELMQETSENPEDQEVLKKPGKLLPKLTLDLKTRQAHSLVFGRAARKENIKLNTSDEDYEEKAQNLIDEGFEYNEALDEFQIDQYGIVGLTSYAKSLNTRRFDAAKNDIYAVYHLLTLERAIDQTRSEIEKLFELDGQLPEGMDFANVGYEAQPVTVELTFLCASAYKAAYALKYFDDKAAQMLALSHLGLISGQAVRDKLSTASRMFRKLFLLPPAVKTEVRWSDYDQNTDKYQEAVQKHGELPADFLNGKTLPLTFDYLNQRKDRRILKEANES